jgi:hypothetical protein
MPRKTVRKRPQSPGGPQVFHPCGIKRAANLTLEGEGVEKQENGKATKFVTFAKFSGIMYKVMSLNVIEKTDGFRAPGVVRG